MFCTNCGHRAGEARFCSQCGMSQDDPLRPLLLKPSLANRAARRAMDRGEALARRGTQALLRAAWRAGRALPAVARRAEHRAQRLYATTRPRVEDQARRIHAWTQARAERAWTELSKLGRPATVAADRFCTQCGGPAHATHRFCRACGAPLNGNAHEPHLTQEGPAPEPTAAS